MRHYGRFETKTAREWLGWGLGAVLLLGGCYTGVEDTLPAQPRSLEGVDVDGTLTLTSSGGFELDAGARALFDHFLAAEGEVDEAALHARVRAEIDRQLPAAAAEQAWEAFLAYLDYRREAAALMQGEAAIEAAALPGALAEIRARTIGDAPGVPDEGPRLRAALAMQAVLTDPSLDGQARAQRMAALQAELNEAPAGDAPSKILGRVHAALASIPMEDVTARRAVLGELVGDAAADRWLALERRRAEDLAARG
jgi:lipase chaperone LimK